MRVLVTGGTGFVGSHTMAALRHDGHTVRTLARSPEKANRVLAEHAADAEIVVGDMTDADAVDRAVDGCDAVVHAAAQVAVDRGSQGAGANASGARLVLTAASKAGLDPIIYTSSVSVHLPCPDETLTASSPLATPMSAYGASKLEAELCVRDLVEHGYPVTTFVIGGVYGPTSPHLDNSFAAILAAIEAMMLTPPGGTNVIDVRDLAQLISRAVVPGRGCRRYLAGGSFVTWPEWVDALGRAAGRPVASQAITPADIVAMGKKCDALRAAGEPSLPLSEEAAIIMCSGIPTDDEPTLDDLGVRYRPLHETLTDTVTYLRAIGRLP